MIGLQIKQIMYITFCNFAYDDDNRIKGEQDSMNESIEKALYNELKEKVEGGLLTRRGIMGALKAGDNPEQAMYDLYYFLKSKKIVGEEEFVAKMKHLREKYDVTNVIVAKKAKSQIGMTNNRKVVF